MGKHTPGTFIIGITGNIGSGKSLVLKMLEQKGAFVIDADAISRRVMQKDAPAYQPVLDAFGSFILQPDGEIDRRKLGRIVFADAEALHILEAIVHPLVRQAIAAILDNHTGPETVIALEAVKLLEGPLHDLCDAVWVVSLPYEIALRRLTKRGLAEDDARQRLNAQGSDEPKRAVADLVIDNSGSPSDSWKQVSAAYNTIVEAQRKAAALAAESPLRRYRPGELPQLAAFINQAAGEGHTFVPSDDRAFLFLKEAGVTQAAIGWYAENYIARATHFFALPTLEPATRQKALLALLNAVTEEAAALHCEVLLAALPANALPEPGSDAASALSDVGFVAKPKDQLGVRAWGDAAKALQGDGSEIYLKPLGTERVLKPL